MYLCAGLLFGFVFIAGKSAMNECLECFQSSSISTHKSNGIILLFSAPRMLGSLYEVLCNPGTANYPFYCYIIYIVHNKASKIL